jgi:hypothetical protein
MSNQNFIEEEDRERLPAILSQLEEYGPEDETGDNFPAENSELEEYWPGVFAECSRAMTPAPAVPKIPPGYLPWLRVTITEECVPA